jgi:DNA primase
MDALRLHIHGYTEAVASLGTALTEEQAKLLKRFSNNCYICYDSDAAGQDAAIKGMYTLQSCGLDVYVIELPAGKDPDELLSSGGGKESFESALSSARPLVLQHLHSVRGLLLEPSNRRRGVESLFEGLLQLTPAAIAPYVPKLASDLGFYPDQFWRELDTFRKSKKTERSEQVQAEERKAVARESYDPLEAGLCAILWRDGECRRSHSPEDILPLLTDERTKEIALAIMTDSPQELEARWHMMNDRFPLSLLAQGDSFCDQLTASPDPWSDICEALKRKRIKERLDYLDGRMKRREASLEEMTEFQRVAASLKGKKAGVFPFLANNGRRI